MAMDEDIRTKLAAQRLPVWQELPDLELYMDQVLAYTGRTLAECPGFDERGLTANMVNNYVKQGVLPPPQKKRYTRVHLAHLLLICVLKASLPIAVIRGLIVEPLAQEPEKFYDGFCALYRQTGADASRMTEPAETGAAERVIAAALRARSEQAYALELYGRMEHREGEEIWTSGV